MIRKANSTDIDAIEKIYDEIHQAEAEGRITTGWLRDIYPVRATAEAALQRGDLFVLEDENIVSGAGVINQVQVDVYHGAPWEHTAEDDQVCVFHTLVIAPRFSKRGLGRQFIDFYETYARNNRWYELRIDTNERNLVARAMYRKLGYKEISIIPTVFNGIPDVNLVLLEKWLG